MFEPYSIIIGNPAICIKKRFCDEIIEILQQIDFSTLDERFIAQHLDILYRRLDKHIALEIKDKLSQGKDDETTN